MFYERAVKCQCGADLPSSVFWQLLRSYSISVANILAITCPIWPKLSHVSVTSWQNDVRVCCCAVDAFRLSLHMRTAQSCCLFQAVAAAVNRKHFTVCHRDLSEKKKIYIYKAGASNLKCESCHERISLTHNCAISTGNTE